MLPRRLTALTQGYQRRGDVFFGTLGSVPKSVGKKHWHDRQRKRHPVPAPNDPEVKLALASYPERLFVNPIRRQFLSLFKGINVIRGQETARSLWHYRQASDRTLA